MLRSRVAPSMLAVVPLLALTACRANVSVSKDAQLTCNTSKDCPLELRFCVQNRCYAEAPEVVTPTVSTTSRFQPTLTQAPDTVAVLANDQINALASPNNQIPLRVTAQRAWRERENYPGDPGPRSLFGTAYDSARGQLVVFGGDDGNLFNELWEWDTSEGTWTLRQPGDLAPAPRADTAIAYDSRRGVIVLFGGGSNSTTGVLDDTWEWDGSAGVWKNSSPGSRPPARRGAALAYDASRGVTVLFGGTDGAGKQLGDLWEWDGQTWAQRSSGGGPSARSQAAFTGQTACGTMLLFGGSSSQQHGTSQSLGDTWEWDGKSGTWTQRMPGSCAPGTECVPDPRSHGGLVHDPATGTTWLFGGRQAETNTDENDLWEWSCQSRTWKQATPVTAASPRPNGIAAPVWDNARQALIVWGGQHGALNTDLWEWDPATSSWRDLSPAPQAPPARALQATAYDPLRHKTVLFGGQGDSSPLGDVWEWDGSNWQDVTPNGAGPGPRVGASAVYDPVDQKTLFFGGLDNVGVPHADLGAWDGSTWTQLSALSANGPPARWQAASTWLTYQGTDGMTHGRLVVFGGAQTVNDTKLLDDLWTWDPGPNGGTWREIMATSPAADWPPKQYGSSLTADPTSGSILLFGGLPMNNFWQLDASTGHWTQLTPSGHVPPARIFGTFLWDAHNNEAILLGGLAATRYGFEFLDDAWLWSPANQSWTLANQVAQTGPGGRTISATIDTDRHRLVVFGGRSLDVNADTWELDLDSGAWTQRGQQVVQPPALSFHASAWDSKRQKLVAFGGLSADGPVATTFEWDPENSSWVQYFPVQSPSPRFNAAATYEPVTNKTWLFGGQDTRGVPLDDIWSWDGDTHQWAQVTPSGAGDPGGREGHAVAYDSDQKRVVLFGGVSDSGLQNDLWAWDAPSQTWSQLWSEGSSQCEPTAMMPGTCPTARSNMNMVYDASQHRFVVVGGWNMPNMQPFVTVDDDWTWNGSQWAPLSGSASSPGSRFGASMIYDVDRALTVLFGGALSKTHLASPDTWELSDSPDGWNKERGIGGPPARVFAGSAYDAARGATYVFGGNANGQAQSDLWIWDGGTGNRAAVIWSESLQAGNPLSSLEFSVVAGGHGTDANGQDVPGVEVLAWNTQLGAWQSLQKSSAALEAPAATEVSLSNAQDLAPLLAGNGTITFAIASLSASGRSAVPASLTVKSVSFSFTRSK